MIEDFVKSLLPKGLLDHFKMVKFIEKICEQTGEIIYELHLEDYNALPLGYSRTDYQSKGFLSGDQTSQMAPQTDQAKHKE